MNISGNNRSEQFSLRRFAECNVASWFKRNTPPTFNITNKVFEFVAKNNCELRCEHFPGKFRSYIQQKGINKLKKNIYIR